VVPLPDEDTETFCGRLCQEQATGPALVKMAQLNDCIVGRCMDCSMPQQGISSAQCKQLCGVSYSCEEDYNACVGDAGCLDALGCIYKCEQSDAACRYACVAAAPIASADELNAYNACYGEVDDCVALVTCGDGKCDFGETCPADCTSGPHVCDAACGSSVDMSGGGACYCDTTCKTNGDCCDAEGTSASSPSCAGSTCGSCD